MSSRFILTASTVSLQYCITFADVHHRIRDNFKSNYMEHNTRGPILEYGILFNASGVQCTYLSTHTPEIAKAARVQRKINLLPSAMLLCCWLVGNQRNFQSLGMIIRALVGFRKDHNSTVHTLNCLVTSLNLVYLCR